MKSYIKEYKNYSVRKLGRYLIATPKEAYCYTHKIMAGESNEFAFKEMIKIIASDIGKNGEIKYLNSRNNFIQKYKEQLTIPMIEDLLKKQV